MRDSLIVDIVEAMEAEGIPRVSYQRREYADSDALEDVVDSFEGDFSSSFSVESTRLEFTRDEVEATHPSKLMSQPPG